MQLCLSTYPSTDTAILFTCFEYRQRRSYAPNLFCHLLKVHVSVRLSHILIFRPNARICIIPADVLCCACVVAAIPQGDDDSPFDPRAQQDVHEFFNVLLQRLEVRDLLARGCHVAPVVFVTC